MTEQEELARDLQLDKDIQDFLKYKRVQHCNRELIKKYKKLERRRERIEKIKNFFRKILNLKK